VSSQAPTARSDDSTDPDFRPIAVYINEVHENGAHTSTTEQNWTLDKIGKCSSHTASARSIRFVDEETIREKQEVKLSNGEILPELGTHLEQTNSDKLLKDNSLPGRQAPKASPYGLYRSKTLNSVVTKKALDKSVLDNFRLEREPTTVTSQNIGFITQEDLRPMPKFLRYNDLWQPLDDSVNCKHYRMRPNRVRKSKTTLEKKNEIVGRKVSDGEMSTYSRQNSSHSVVSIKFLQFKHTVITTVIGSPPNLPVYIVQLGVSLP
jgi:hypothetical protein